MTQSLVLEPATTFSLVFCRYLLEEHLLELPQARPELGLSLTVPQDLLGLDEFENFPPAVRPQNLCTIVGGIGARSFLHWSAFIPLSTLRCRSSSHAAAVFHTGETTIPYYHLVAWRGHLLKIVNSTSVLTNTAALAGTLYIASGELTSVAETYLVVYG